MSDKRYRCTGCGNLTRFDVIADTRSKSFYHYEIGGELHIEDEEIISRNIVEVICRWCGPGTACEEVEIPYADAAGVTEISEGA